MLTEERKNLIFQVLQSKISTFLKQASLENPTQYDVVFETFKDLLPIPMPERPEVTAFIQQLDKEFRTLMKQSVNYMRNYQSLLEK